MQFIFWFSFVVVLFVGTEAAYNATTEDFVSRGKLRFFLYKRDNINKSYELQAGNATNMEHFNPEIPTYVFCHGYAGSYINPIPQVVKNAFLKKGEANVMLVDFYFISTPYLFLYYNYEAIGVGIANFINYMQRYGLNIQDCTLIGHSFGAHIVGVAARHLDDELPVLYGLDPAGPLFKCTPAKKRLDKDCARSVIVLYTSSNLGINRPIGNINYFINSGKDQPSCVNFGDIENLSQGCSHNFAVYLFANAVESSRKFNASKCATALQAKCNLPCAQTSGILLFSNAKERPSEGIYNVKTP